MPIIKANFGFGMGGGNTEGVKRGGGSGGGGGAVIVPIAILVVCGKEVELLVIDKSESSGLAPLLEKLPFIIEKMPFGKKKKPAEEVNKEVTEPI